MVALAAESFIETAWVRKDEAIEKREIFRRALILAGVVVFAIAYGALLGMILAGIAKRIGGR